MPKRIYNGPCPEVEVVLPDGGSLTCQHGESIDVPAAVASNLDAQGDWLGGPKVMHGESVADLRTRATDTGIEIPKRATKAQLEQLLEQHAALSTDGEQDDPANLSGDPGETTAEGGEEQS